ncbi:hypothetical protein HPB52_021248 [Rhipicephalus sanguineus]|uniref:Uncharacterized protein n=1 Tax=Rhipicephalus sanguineus TaxID=34632 RepID=A0A9D4T1U7_RHISA|nr:hypothetical protein HPB52_021248 [Rhipicephalus sanguineus]
MFAVVRFLNDHDNRSHVIHVHDIENFDPKDTSDYDNRSVYNAYWHDPVDDTNSGLYNTQVLMLAGKRCPRFPDRPAKAPLTPWKVEVMRDCYRRRLQRQGIPETLMPAALKQLNHFVVEKLADLERLAKR